MTARLPVVGADGNAWGTLLNEYLEVAHNADGTLKAGGSGGYPSAHLVRFVDYANGNDQSSGLAPASPMKTIQAAYNDLATVMAASYTASLNWNGVGRIYLAPGAHDVGAGLDIDGWNAVEIYGQRGGMGGHAVSNSVSRIVSSSSAATYMVRVRHANQVSRGTRIWDVAFVPDAAVNTSLTRIISLHSNLYADIRWCSFDTSDHTAELAIPAIYQDFESAAQDSMAGRFIDNWCARMQFYKSAGGNLNRIQIEKNKTVYAHATLATIELSADFRGGSVSFNQMEGTATHIRVDGSDCNSFFANSGEMTTVTNPYMEFKNTAHRNTVIGGDVTCPVSTGTNGVYVIFQDPTTENTYLGHGSPEGRAGFKEAVIDNSWAGNRVYPARQRSVTSVKIAAYDIVRRDRLVRCDSTAGAFTVRLPNSVKIYQDYEYTIRNYGSANAVTVGSQGGSIVGATSVAAGAACSYMTDGAGGSWYQV